MACLALLDLFAQVLLGEPFEAALKRWSARVWVDDGGIHNEGMGEFQGIEVGIEGMADQHGTGGDNRKESFLDIGKGCRDRFQNFFRDAREPGQIVYYGSLWLHKLVQHHFAVPADQADASEL